MGYQSVVCGFFSGVRGEEVGICAEPEPLVHCKTTSQLSTLLQIRSTTAFSLGYVASHSLITMITSYNTGLHADGGSLGRTLSSSHWPTGKQNWGTSDQSACSISESSRVRICILHTRIISATSVSPRHAADLAQLRVLPSGIEKAYRLVRLPFNGQYS